VFLFKKGKRIILFVALFVLMMGFDSLSNVAIRNGHIAMGILLSLMVSAVYFITLDLAYGLGENDEYKRNRVL
jgi:hypothetical protein